MFAGLIAVAVLLFSIAAHEVGSLTPRPALSANVWFDLGIAVAILGLVGILATMIALVVRTSRFDLVIHIPSFARCLTTVVPPEFITAAEWNGMFVYVPKATITNAGGLPVSLSIRGVLRWKDGAVTTQAPYKESGLDRWLATGSPYAPPFTFPLNLPPDTSLSGSIGFLVSSMLWTQHGDDVEGLDEVSVEVRDVLSDTILTVLPQPGEGDS